MDTKICSRCEIEKASQEFYPDKSKKSGLSSRCRKCVFEATTEWKQKNPDKCKDHLKAHYIAHSTQVQTYHKKRYQEKKESILASNADWRKRNKQRHSYLSQRNKKKRMAEDPSVKIAEYQRVRIRRALMGIDKSQSTRQLLGCSAEFLRGHLQAQFQPGMTWENYGEWHVDHIRPCASFNLANPGHQQICFHYTNLQPLWAIDNLKKSDRYA